MPDTWTSFWPQFATVNEPIEVLIELLLIGVVVHWLASVLQGTRGTRPLRALLALIVVTTLVVRMISVRLGWTRLDILYRYFLFCLGVVMLIAFQPELRRAMFRLGDLRLMRRRPEASRIIAALVKSASYLSKNKYGAIIAIERSVNLQSWAETGTIVNAELSSNLLNSIFFPNSPLHDMGVILRGDCIVAANCQFPLAEGDEIDSTLGSRHLAAVSMSYETDALVLVVSEETGAISIADNGELLRFLSLDDLSGELSARLSATPTAAKPNEKPTSRPAWRRAWRFARYWGLVAGLTAAVWYLADQTNQIEVEGAKLSLAIATRSGDRSVEIIDPQPALFSVTLRGPARAANALRNATLDEPMQVTWLLKDDNALGVRTIAASELLGQCRELLSRGVHPTEVRPDIVRYRVDEQVQVMMPIRLNSRELAVDDVVIEPASAEVTMTRTEYEELPQEARFVEANLPATARAARPGEVLELTGVTLSNQVGDARAAVKPETVKVIVRVGGTRTSRKLTGIPVTLQLDPGMLENYVVERRDPNEFLVDITVEGDRAAVNSLAPSAIRAYVVVDGRLEPAGDEFRSIPVQVDLPRGVDLVPPARTVQLRLVPRPSTP
jgi:diadenylate cyclase